MSHNRFKLILFALLSVTLLVEAASATADGEWWLARTKENGNDLLYRALATLPDEATLARYPSRAVVDWVYLPRADGMPNRDTSEQMYALEDFMEQKVENAGSAKLAFTRTGNGNKQWNYYVADKSAFEAALAAETQSKHSFPVQLRFVSDPSWEALRELHRAAGK